MEYIYLKNHALRVEIGRMGSDNQRFDHLGHVAQVWDLKDGISYLSKERNPFILQNSGYGICDEHGPSNPIGFQSAKINDYFLKIGCGRLKKTEETYHFSKVYPSIPVNVQMALAENSITFRTTDHWNGYAYEYEKQITLIDRSVIINCKIKNIGEKLLQWQSYGHNFFLAGSQDCCNLNIDLEKMNLKKLSLNTGDDILHHNNSLYSVIKTPINNPLYLGEFNSSHCESYKYILHHKRKAIIEQGNFQPIKFKIWIDQEAFCPECFIDASVEPHNEFSWKREFEFL